jgi:hypothetical protein
MEVEIGATIQVILMSQQYFSSANNHEMRSECDSEYFQHENCDSIGNTQRININETFGLVIHFPDILISPTRIVEACQCVRKSIISERAKASHLVDVGDSIHAIMGTLKHDFIEVSFIILIDMRLLKPLLFDSVWWK